MLITSDVLRAAAVEHLRYRLKCRLVCTERSPFIRDPCTPDVIGVTDKRKVIEIELKMSWSDFKANRAKTSLYQRRFYGIRPWRYFFLVPPEMKDRVLAALEEGEGLLTIGDGSNVYTGLPKVVSVRPATIDRESRPLALKEIVRMVSHQTGSLVSALAKVAKLKNPDAVPDEMASI